MGFGRMGGMEGLLEWWAVVQEEVAQNGGGHDGENFKRWEDVKSSK